MQLNEIIISRKLQEYIDNICNLTDDEKQIINAEINNNQLNTKTAINNSNINSIIKNKYDEFIQMLNNEYNDNITLSIKKQQNLMRKIFKFCTYMVAQAEITRNMQFNIGDNVNNLSFSPQDLAYREKPIVICREFLNNKTYKDHVLIGKPLQHHRHVLSDNEQLLARCKYNNIDYFTCAYLYPNNIIYLSSKENNPYSSLQEVANIIKKQYPQASIFEVAYKTGINNQENKSTKRLAKKLQ